MIDRLHPAVQFGTVEVPLALVAVAILVQVATVALGLGIVYLAYRGYVRNESRPMLFLAAGFFLLVAVPAVVGIVAFAVTGLAGPGLFTGTINPAFYFVLGVVSSSSQLAGMVAIAYGLWIRA